jgi:hypothetical protein
MPTVNDTLKTSLIVGVAVFGITFATVKGVNYLRSGAELSEGNRGGDEFVCYDDGKLTERHVGVRSAVVSSRTAYYWIYYVDSDETVDYWPKPGETCGIETITITKKGE